jgi:hypothetical protein
MISSLSGKFRFESQSASKANPLRKPIRFESQDGIARSSHLGIANLSLPILRTVLRLEHFNSPHAVLQALGIF